MIIRTGEYYQHKPKVWDAAKCARMVRSRPKDGYGTPFPKGYLSPPSPFGWGKIRYNGGCLRPRTAADGDWYEGEVFPLPIVAEGFELVSKPSWGWFIEAVEGKES